MSVEYVVTMPAQRGGREVRNARRARARERSPRELCRLHPFIVTKPRAAAAVPLAVEDPPTGTKACFLRVRGIQMARLPLSPGAEVEASSWIASPAPSLHLRTGGDATARYVSLGRPRLSPRAAHISRAFPVAQRNIRRHVVVALSFPSSPPPLVAPRVQ